MKRKTISKALLLLLGKLPKRIQDEQMTAGIVCDGEYITVNRLVVNVVNMLDEAAKCREEEEVK